MVAYSDLPPAMQAKVDAALGTTGKRKRPSRAEIAGPSTPYRCVPCGDRFPSFTRWERHSRASGHGRGEAII